MCNAVTNTVTNKRRNDVRRFVQTRPDQTRLFLLGLVACVVASQNQEAFTKALGLGAER